MEDEARWAKSIAAGDRAAFERFLDAFGPRLHRLARRFAPIECDAEDLTQEIFVALFQSIGSFRGGSRLSTWVYRVALNHCLRHRERAQRQSAHLQHQPADTSTCIAGQAPGSEPAEAHDHGADPAHKAARREMRQQVRLSLQDLSDGHRDVVVLHELHGMTYNECAQVLGIPLGTVKSRLFNAFRHLRRHLGPYVLEQEPDAEQEPAPARTSGACSSSASNSSASTSPSPGEAP